jgi:5-methylcytosine-specific restriction endonuclease McrA
MRAFRPQVAGRLFSVEGKRLSGDNWTRFRNRYIRLNPSCEDCGAPGVEVHHIVPRAVRPDLCFDLHNLRTQCRECHLAKHGGEKPHY